MEGLTTLLQVAGAIGGLAVPMLVRTMGYVLRIEKRLLVIEAELGLLQRRVRDSQTGHL